MRVSGVCTLGVSTCCRSTLKAPPQPAFEKLVTSNVDSWSRSKGRCHA